MTNTEWLRWRIGLAVGKFLKMLGRNLLDAGWKISDRAAMRYDHIVNHSK